MFEQCRHRRALGAHAVRLDVRPRVEDRELDRALGQALPRAAAHAQHLSHRRHRLWEGRFEARRARLAVLEQRQVVAQSHR